MVSGFTDVPSVSRLAFLGAAEEIGRHICRDAIWHGDRCNWLGALPEEGPGGLLTETYTTLTADLYGGTSGVAVFLASLYRETGDETARRTSLGAIRQALARADDSMPVSSRGVYGGRTGLAVAAGWVGRLLGEQELLEASVLLLDGVEEMRSGGPREFDLIAGAAGGVVGCLVTMELLGDRRLLGLARDLGDELLETAARTDAGWSWASPAFPTSGNLTGFSHGAGGVGYALLELHRATGDDRYRHGARRAFDYEHSLFDPAVKNWPDLRRLRSAENASRGPSFATYWCHGAPGITLSRLRAFQLLREDELRGEIEAGLDTTRRWVAAVMPSRAANFSICHGLAGNAEVLLFGQQVLGAGGSEGGTLALRVAETGIADYPARGLPWPCGTQGGESPTLFLGLAGIGFFYLRLAAPDIPSVLMLKAEDFRSLGHPRGSHGP